MSRPAADVRARPRPAPPRQSRRRWALLVGAAVLIILIGLVVAAYLLLSARRFINDGVQQIDLARTQLSAVTTTASADKALTGATSRVRLARTDFSAADARLQPLSPLLDHLGWVPSVGGQLAAAPPAARLASTTSDGLLALLNGIRPVVHGAHTHAGGHRLQELSLSIASQRGSFQRAYELFNSAMRIRHTVPAHPPAQLASALRTIDRALPPLRTASLSLTLAPRLLGATSPMSYFIAYQDPLELRATGGFIGSFGLVTINHGLVKQHFENSEIGTREKLRVPAPEPIRFYNEIWWLLRDSNWSPDFPTTAAVERYFVRMDLGENPTGVINVTPQAAAAVLAATGPMYVPEYHRTVTAANLAALTDYYAHWAPHASKRFIPVVASHLIARIQSLDVRGWLSLASHLQDAVARGDLLLQFPGTQDERLVRLLGASGAMSRTTADYLYIVDSNLSFNKINPYVHESIRYNVTVRSDRWLDARLSIRLWNQPEPAYRMSQGAGPGGGALGGPDDYASFLRVYVPAGGQLVDQSGWTDPWTPGPAYGKTEFPGYVIVRRGKTAVIRLHYVVPPNALSWSGGRRYRLVLPHQPGSHPDSVVVTVHDVLGGTRTWRLPHPSRQWSITAPIAPRAIQPIPLPRQQPAVVAPGHWLEPHLYFQGPHV